MGRDYFGDIDGRFWFAVQDSDAADRFGVTGVEPSGLYYYFGEGELGGVEAELKVIEEQLGIYKTKLCEFFNSNQSYTDEDLVKYLDLPYDKVKNLLKEYADYVLGIRIKERILESGYCEFTAEY